MTRILSIAYAALMYGFIFLPVAVLILFSFQARKCRYPRSTGHR